MPKNVVITPLSGLVDFYDLAGNLDAKIQISDAGDLSISNTGGVVSIGNTASNVYIGDGTSSVDVIFEQNGAIRALTGKTLTLGNSASSVTIASPLTINSQILNTSTTGYFEVRQTVPAWTNSTSHPIIKWDFNATYDDHLYLASGGNATGTNQTALVVTELGGVIIGAGPSAPNSSSVVSAEWFRLDNSRFTITRNSTQSLTFENSDTTVNPTIISYSAPANAKNIIFDSKTDASNTAVSAGTLGYEFRVAGTSALSIATDRSSTFSNHVTPSGTNLYTLGSSGLLWSNVYATTFTGALTGNASGSAATFTSTTQNSQFNSVGVGVAASGTAGRLNVGDIIAGGYISAAGGVGQLQAVSGATSSWYNAFLRNDGTNVYLLSSAVQTTQALATNATWNAYRPFSWALTTGIVTIDGTGVGALFGGAVTGTSFNGVTGLSSTTPIVAGTATVGTGTTVARADHVHPAQTTVATATNIAGGAAGSIPYQTAAGATSLLATGTGVLIGGSTPSYTTTPTLTGTNFTGIPNAGLTNSSVTIGSTSVSLGGTITAISGLGVVSGTSFNSITGLSSTTPVVAGTAAVGTGTTVARADHVHPAQTTVTTATNIAGGAAGSIPYQTAAGATSLLATGTGVLIGGATPSYTTTPTLTGTNFTGIPNGALTNSSVTIGSTSVSLGGTITAISGLGVVAGTSFNSITGLSSTTPVVAGTAAIGTGTTAARGDHVHPAQTTITGNAGSANKITGGAGAITDVNTAASLTAGDVYFQTFSSTATNNPDVADNANGLLTLVSHPSGGTGTYGKQISFANNTNLRMRSFSNGTYAAWNTLLHSANYNSYSPTLTGTGASGTWAISVSGNAATVTNLLLSNTVNNGIAVAQNYIGYISDYSGTVLTAGVTDGALYNQYYSGSWQHQIYGDYRSGQLAVRGKNNGTWQAWRIQLDSSNYSSYALPLSGGTLTGALAGTTMTMTPGTTGVSTGLTVINGDITTYRSGGTTGVIYLSNSGTKYLYWDGTNYNMPGGNIVASNITAAGNVTGSAASATNATYATSAGSATNASAATNAGFATNATYATSAGSATNATYATSAGSATSSVRIIYADGPRDLSDRLPNTSTRTVNFDFVGAATANGSGNYGGVMTYSPWSGTTASTGDSSYQLAFANLSGVNAAGQPKLSIRNGIDSTWNAWYTLLHSGNYSSYALPLSGGSISGNLLFTNGRKGLIGQYDASQTQAIFAMGSSYILTDGGASNVYGNFYGMAWSYNPDYGGAGNNPQSKAGLNHQLLIMQAGVTTAAIGLGVWTSGNVTAYSDSRVKTNITKIDNALEKVKQISGYTFDRTDIKISRQTGVIAQEVLKVLPEAVTGSEKLTYSVAYGNMVGLLIEAIKEQQTIIDSQEERINRLEEMLNRIIKE